MYTLHEAVDGSIHEQHVLDVVDVLDVVHVLDVEGRYIDIEGALCMLEAVLDVDDGLDVELGDVLGEELWWHGIKWWLWLESVALYEFGVEVDDDLGLMVEIVEVEDVEDC